MNRKERMVVSLVVVVLCGFIFRIGVKRFGLFEQSKQQSEENVQVLKMMSELENEVACERLRDQLSQFTEETSCSPEYLNVETESDGVVTSEQNAQQGEMSKQDTKEMVGVNKGDQLPEYSKLYPDLYVDKIHPSKKTEGQSEKIAYLTFDDGPSSNTLTILNTLKEKNAVATFFILGSTITDDGKEALKEMVNMGCAIGLHTYSHDQKQLYSSVESFLNDINQVYEQVYEITGVKPNIYRFPWGSYNRYCKAIKKDVVAEMDRRGFTYYDWNVSAEDSVGKPTAYSIMKNVMKDVKKYSTPVILMHDSNENKLTMQTLPEILDQLIEMGYGFGTLDQREPCQFCY